VMKLDYTALNSLVRSKVPYRGTNEYPMDNRSNRTNIVKLVETETDIEFHVCHGYEYVRTPITKELYEKLDGVQNVNTSMREVGDGTFKYEKYSTTPRVLCIVRSDNSLEYTCDYYHQGDSMKMSDWSNGYQYQSMRMGGNAYWCSSSKMNHPIFKGLRINQETREPIGMDVKVFRRSVNRKKAMELMRGYKEAITIPDKLLHCMDTDTMLVSVIDILQDKLPASGGRNSTRIGVEYTSSAGYFKVAEECLAKRLKVVTHYGLGEIKSLATKNDKCQWAEIVLDDPARSFEAPRCLYLSSICRYMPASDVDAIAVNSIF